MLIGEVCHNLADLFQHTTCIGTGFAPDVFNVGDGVDRIHNFFRTCVHIDLQSPLCTDNLNGTSGDLTLLDIACRSLDDDCGTVADQSAGNGNYLLGLLGSQTEQSSDTVRIGKHFYNTAGRGNLDGSPHAQGHLIDQTDLINDGDLTVQSIANQHTIVPLDDGGSNLLAVRNAVIDQMGCNLEIHCTGDNDNIVLAPRCSLKLSYQNGFANADANATGRCGVVADHSGLSDDGLGNGLHGHVTDNRSRLVQANFSQVLDGQPRCLQGIIQRMEDTVDILSSTLDAGGRHSATRKESCLSVLNPGQRGFS